MNRPLRSTPVTRVSALLRAGPPARPATVLNPSRFQPLETLPLIARPHRRQRPCRGTPSHVPRESSRSGSRRLHAGHRLANQRAPARLLPGHSCFAPVPMPPHPVTTLQQRFTCVRLPDPHLTPLRRLFHIAHHEQCSTCLLY